MNIPIYTVFIAGVGLFFSITFSFVQTVHLQNVVQSPHTTSDFLSALLSDSVETEPRPSNPTSPLQQ